MHAAKLQTLKPQKQFPPVVQVFATILAMITDEINNVMLAARSGKAPVALSGHILLLNWNQQVNLKVV